MLAMTLELPPDGSTHWSVRRLAAATGISSSTVHRIWRDHKLKPHQVRSFKFSKDPQLAEKVVDVVGLYLDPPDGAIVLSVGEKTQIQALDRTQPTLPMKPGKAQRMTHDYKRNGTTSLYAALEIATGEVTGSCYPRHTQLVEIAPRFSRIETLHDALPSMCLIEEIPLAASFLAGHAHAEYRRAGGDRQAILPDFLIGAHAAVTGRPLLTRDPARVANYIPGAELISPCPNHPNVANAIAEGCETRAVKALARPLSYGLRLAVRRCSAFVCRTKRQMPSNAGPRRSELIAPRYCEMRCTAISLF